MSGPSRVLFSLYRDPMLIEKRDNEDRFLQHLVDDLHAEPTVEPKRQQRDDLIELEDEEEDLEEDAMEDPHLEPEKEAVAAEEDPIAVEEGSAVDPMAKDEGWIEDPLEESDDESHINYDEVLRHIDDPPPEGWDDEEDQGIAKDTVLDDDGEGFIDWDTELRHMDDLPPKEQGLGR